MTILLTFKLGCVNFNLRLFGGVGGYYYVTRPDMTWYTLDTLTVGYGIYGALVVGGGRYGYFCHQCGTRRVMVGGNFFVWRGTFCFSGGRLHCVYFFSLAKTNNTLGIIRYFYGPAVDRIEAVNPAHTGFLGGVDLLFSSRRFCRGLGRR